MSHQEDIYVSWWRFMKVVWMILVVLVSWQSQLVDWVNGSWNTVLEWSIMKHQSCHQTQQCWFNMFSIKGQVKHSFHFSFLHDNLGNIFPFPFSAPSSYTMTVDDIPPIQGWLLMKWRPVTVNVLTNEISELYYLLNLQSIWHQIVGVGDWIGFQYLKAGELTCWIVSSLNSNIMGFILKGVLFFTIPCFLDVPIDVQTHLSRVYLFRENSLVSQISIQFNTSFHLQRTYLDEVAAQHAYLSIPSLIL